MEEAYKRISFEQEQWFQKSRFTCPEGCGSCCHNFEPDLLECEALYMAAWLLENQSETAEKVGQGIFPFDNGKTCPFYNPDNPYHCSIYEGRPFVCRLFGASGTKGKTGETVFKPCKFYPLKELEKRNPPLAHRQYSEEEVKSIFGILPPVMSDMMESAVSINPENHDTVIIREILPAAIQRLKWIISMIQD